MTLRGRLAVLAGAGALVALPAGAQAASQRLISRPDLHPPAIVVHGAGSAAGDVLLAPKWGRGQWGPEIVDGRGQLVWFHPRPRGLLVGDLKVSSFGGHPVLSWWQGKGWRGHGKGECVVMNTLYHVVAVVRGASGLPADMHECLPTPQGTVIVDSYIAATTDLRRYGGSKRGPVYDGVAEEIDPRTHRLLHRWDSVLHVPVSESAVHPPRRGARWDYFHINSVKPAPDGTWIVSARNTSTVYDVDPNSGRVIWRLGGRHSDFRMGPGTGFAYQHDAVWHPDGTLTVFDDESPPGRGTARGLTLRLSFTGARRPLSATLAGQYPEPHRQVVNTQGSMEPLPGGGAFVGWGQVPGFSEFDAAGHLTLDGTLPAGYQSYRAYLAPWHATPTSPPALVAHRGHRGVRLYASWNGATDVASWRALGGTSSHTLRPLRTVRRRGFETAFNVSRTRVVEVQALDAGGRVMGTSPLVRP